MATQVEICNLALRRLGAEEITAIDEGSKNADHCSAFWTYILDEVLDDYPWNFAKKSRSLAYTSGFAVFSDSDIKTISNITQADPAVVTCATHGFLNEHTVYIYDVLGMTEVNGRVYEIEKIDANSFRLLGIDSSPWTAYDSCGSCVRKEAQSKYQNGYSYDLPADFLRALFLDGGGEYEIMGTGYNRRLLTTTKDAVLVYEAEETVTTNMLNRFISVAAWRLAAELAIPLSKKGANQEKMMAMYNYTLGKGSSADARSEKMYFEDNDSWLSSFSV
jgi:hypothetical protein